MTRDLFIKLAQAVMELDDTQAIALTKQALHLRLDPIRILEQGLADGLRQVGREFEAGERFIPELVLAAEVVESAAELLEPEMALRGEAFQARGKVVLGTVQGDIHDIGKNIVAAMLRASGFEVFDLGIDVQAAAFVEKASEIQADIIGASALLTTTMGKQRELVEVLEGQGLRDEFKVMVGGASTSQQWVDQIGADAHAGDAAEAVRIAEQLVPK